MDMFGWYGRGFGRGWGAALGYCPWTGLPRGWRWWGYWPGYSAYPYTNWPGYWTNPYTPYTAQNYPGYTWTYGTIDEKTALENEYRYLQERLEDVKRRLDELKK